MFDHLSISLVLFAQGESILLTFVSTSPTLGRNISKTLTHFKPKAPSSRTRLEIPKGTDLHMLLGFDKNRGRQWRNDTCKAHYDCQKGHWPIQSTRKHQGTTAGHFITFPQHETFIPQCLGAHCWTTCTFAMGTCFATALLFLVSFETGKYPQVAFQSRRGHRHRNIFASSTVGLIPAACMAFKNRLASCRLFALSHAPITEQKLETLGVTCLAVQLQNTSNTGIFMMERNHQTKPFEQLAHACTA